MTTQADPTQVPTEQKVDEGKRIWVGGLSLNRVSAADVDKKRAVLKDAVADLCSHYGRVKQCQLIGKGNSAVVTFDSHEDAEKAIAKLREKKNWSYSYESFLKADWSPVDNRPVEQRKKENRKDSDENRPKKQKKPAMPLSLLTPKNPASTPAQGTAAPRSAWDVPQTPPQKKQDQVETTDSQDEQQKNQGKQTKKTRGPRKGPGPAGEQAVAQGKTQATRKSLTNGSQAQGQTSGQAQSTQTAQNNQQAQSTQQGQANQQGQAVRNSSPAGTGRGRGGRNGGRGGARQGGRVQGAQQGQGVPQNKSQVQVSSGSSYKDSLGASSDTTQTKQTQSPKNKQVKQNPTQKDSETAPEASTEQAVQPETVSASVQTQKQPAKGQQQQKQATKGQNSKQSPKGQNQTQAPKQQAKSPQAQTAQAQKAAQPKGKATNGTAKPTSKEDYQIIVQKAGSTVNQFSVNEEQYQALISLVH